MDKMGNHGGESVLETMPALWIYSKAPLSHPKYTIPEAILPAIMFSGTLVSHHHIQQIDLVPTPFSNLGTIIPEPFNWDSDGSPLHKAMELNAAQIRCYLNTY
jgi:phosphatidylinositol glycan class O